MRLPSETKQQLFIKNLLSENGILFTGAGIFLTVAGTQTSEQAFFLGSICLALILLNSILSSIAGELFQYRIPLRAMVFICSVILSLLAYGFSDILLRLPGNTKILMFLLSASPLVFSRARAFSHATSPSRAIFDAAGQGCGILLVLVAIAFVREMIGSGTMGGSKIFSDPPWALMSSNMGGMILTALGILVFRLSSYAGGKK